jgi:hypothetical protein
LKRDFFYKQFVYNRRMIESFASDETKRLFATGKSRRLPPEILKRAVCALLSFMQQLKWMTCACRHPTAWRR